jgi:ABC-type Fe3+ transport system permease subunit
MTSKLVEWTFLIRAGCARGAVAAFAVVFLSAFGEFEMASLMGVKSWTVAMFDAHAGGLALNESLRRMLGPLLCEAAAIALAIAVLGRHRVVPVRPMPNVRATNLLAWCYLAIAFVAVLGIPATMIFWGTLRGFGLLLENFVLSREIIASLLFAVGATLLAALTVFGLAAMARSSKSGSLFARAILLPAVCAGLLGPLVLSLAVLAAVQLPGLLSLRDTPVPLVVTLGLILVPTAFVLNRVLELTGNRSGLHLALLMPKARPARELTWKLSTSGKFWAIALLFVWAYWDLTASAILAPIGMTPVTVRLYNLMHYGQIATLSAMTCATFLAPVMILLVALKTRSWWAPR